MQPDNTPLFYRILDKVLNRIACRMGYHSYTWKLENGERIILSKDGIPDRAICPYCKKSKSTHKLAKQKADNKKGHFHE